MSMSGVAGRSRVSALARSQAPIVYWAILGGAFLCLPIYVWGSWILSEHFRPVPVGDDPIPASVLTYVRIIEAFALTVATGVIWKTVLRPLLRDREIGFDGLMTINLLLLWWTDPIDNYVSVSFFYNGHTINMGSWAAFIPGWGSPNPENFPEPLLLMSGFYIGFFMLNVFFGCWLLGFLQRRFPDAGSGWRVAMVFVPLAVIDLVVENFLMRTGLAAYPGVVRSVSMFPGEVYQWPLYEAVIIGFICTGFTCLRYFKDDKGQTFVERGVERLQVSKPRRKVLTFLAIAGFLQPFFLIGYYLPYNLFAMRADTVPAYPSYLRNEICGNGTAYACPSYDWVPIPQRYGKNFVGPDAAVLPPEVRDAQGLKSGDADPYLAALPWSRSVTPPMTAAAAEGAR